MQNMNLWQKRVCKIHTPTVAFQLKKNVERNWQMCVFVGVERELLIGQPEVPEDLHVTKLTHILISGQAPILPYPTLWFWSYRTLMGPSTGSSPCSDSCFKALRAAWEEKEGGGTTDGRVSWEVGKVGRVGESKTGWEESECQLLFK